MTLNHPETDRIDLANVLTALGDETRLAMLGYLARADGSEMTCGQFHPLASKTALSYHLARLREAGIVNVRPLGTKRLISLRRADLDQRFPGFLSSIEPSALSAAERVSVPGAEHSTAAEIDAEQAG